MIAALLRRDLAQFFPFTGSGAALPVVFFVAVAMLFPFAVGPDANLLAKTGGGVVWIAALLAAILPWAPVLLLAHWVLDGLMFCVVIRIKQILVKRLHHRHFCHWSKSHCL
jgi:heme exporter protein CcmB